MFAGLLPRLSRDLAGTGSNVNKMFIQLQEMLGNYTSPICNLQPLTVIRSGGDDITNQGTNEGPASNQKFCKFIP